ncbi:MAG: biopolymer transporter ExbD [Candidatus Acidiferrales bacterium]
MGISIGTRGSSMSEPNIVPLIDVLLVLIIIFMAITPTPPTGMDTLIPQPPKVTKLRTPPNAAVVVVVTADGNVMIDQTPTTWSDLGSQLADIFKIRADKTAFVKGGDDAEFTYVARAIDIMRGSGITNVGLITAKMEASQ